MPLAGHITFPPSGQYHVYEHVFNLKFRPCCNNSHITLYVQKCIVHVELGFI